MGKNVGVLVPGASTLFLVLLSISPTLISAQDFVVDSDGHPVIAGVEYYIHTVGLGIRGGIGRSALPGQQFACPQYAVEASEYDRGRAVKFIPEDPTQKYIRISSAVMIDSGYSDQCRDEEIWRLGRIDGSKWGFVIATGDFDAPHTWFRISETYKDRAYKISDGSYPGESLGVHDISDLQVLGLIARDSYQTPLYVRFIRKITTTAATI